MKWASIALFAFSLVACSSNSQPQVPTEVGTKPNLQDSLRDQAALCTSLISSLLKHEQNWREAKFIDIDSFPEYITSANREMFIESGMVFGGVMPVADGLGYLARVGIYEDKQSEKGRFLAIFDSAGNVVQTFEDSTEGAAFSALRLDPGAMRWYKCFECGVYEVLSRIPEGFVLD